MWFDVEKKNYTTTNCTATMSIRLWFDVEKKNYTTNAVPLLAYLELWFDVEKKNYTTGFPLSVTEISCGLM